jgi:cell division transport system permease protein
LIDDKNYTDVSLVSESISKVTGKLEKAGLIISLVFALIAFLLIFNTIRIAIYTHRSEIGIMKLVGATNGFIRWPFILESMIYGLLGWVIAIVILFSLSHFASPYISNFLIDYQMRFDLWSYLWNNFIVIFLSQLVAVLIFVSLSSFLAISRYLKV